MVSMMICWLTHVKVDAGYFAASATKKQTVRGLFWDPQCGRDDLRQGEQSAWFLYSLGEGIICRKALHLEVIVGGKSPWGSFKFSLKSCFTMGFNPDMVIQSSHWLHDFLMICGKPHGLETSIYIHYWRFPNWGYPILSSILVGIFHYKLLGYLHLWKPPYIPISNDNQSYNIHVISKYEPYPMDPSTFLGSTWAMI